MSNILFFVNYGLVLMTGLALSFSFARVPFSKKRTWTFYLLLLLCGIAQLVIYLKFGEDTVWKIYPLITHLPVGIVLYAVFGKRLSTILVSVASAYLCIHPPKWFGLLVETLTKSIAAGYATRIVFLIAIILAVKYIVSPYVSEIYTNSTRSAFMFGLVPLSYYIFDYATTVYTDALAKNALILEFMPFFLCLMFIFFCTVYYREHQRATNAEKKEHIIKITTMQQKNELEAIKQSELETKILRHDMRHLLDSLALSIEQDDKETALKLISGYISQVETATVHRFCENDTINYVLASFASKCEDANIRLSISVDVQELKTDELLLSSVISNALENAINAQKELIEAERQITFMLKTADDKLLLSVKNPYNVKPVFVDDIPVAKQESHGYGTQSIRYITEKLGGKCQFTAQDNMFILRVII